MDLLIGFFIGRALSSSGNGESANPLHLLLGMMLIAAMVAFAALLIGFAPQAEHFIEWTGISHLFPDSDFHIQYSSGRGLGELTELLSRTYVCVIAINIIFFSFLFFAIGIRLIAMAIRRM